jgi:hypothetical protein
MRKRVAVGLGAAALAVLGAVAAFAFFTSSGTGSGSATVGAASNWSMTAGSASGTLYPDSSDAVTKKLAVEPYTVFNTGSGNQALNDVQYSVSAGFSTTGSDTNGDPPCTASDFRLGTNTTVGGTATDNYGAPSTGVDLAPGSSTSGTATIEMIDNGANQNSCQGVSVPLSFSAG